MNVFVKGVKVALNQRDYVAEGGEGKVWAKGSTGYKIYHDPAKMLPIGKIRELAAIKNPNIIRPVDLITDDNGTNIGYTMRFIKDSWAMCQAFTRPFRDRHGITHEMIRDVVSRLQELFVDVHSANILLVDANEMNFLLSPDFKTVFGIDADSYQTPHYYCQAIMPSVRDWTIKPPNWTQGSDWFSFACVSFQLFTGVHPYKGQHPTVKKMEERMQANISIFDKDVNIPKVAYDFSIIPPDYLDWYKSVFVRGARTCPPSVSAMQAVAAVSMAVAVNKLVGKLVVITPVYQYDSEIIRFWSGFGKTVVQTKELAWIGKQQHGYEKSSVCELAFTDTGRAVLVSLYRGKIRLYDLQDQKDLTFDCAAQEISGYDGRVYFRNGEQINQIVLTEAGNSVIASSVTAVNIMPNSSKLFQGVCIQNLLGAVFVSLLEKGGANYQVRIPELDRCRVVEAGYDSGVLMVVAEDKGKYNRMVFRFDDSFVSYDLRTVKDIQPCGLNFVVLDSGVCVAMNEDENLELFSKRKGSSNVKVIDDPCLNSEIRLGKDGGTLLFSKGDQLFSMKMK